MRTICWVRATTRVLVVVGRPATVRSPRSGSRCWSQLGPDGIAVGVVAHDADQPDLGAQGGDVGGDIRRSAQSHPGLAHVDHGNRRFG
jgi:hypothetical protein